MNIRDNTTECGYCGGKITQRSESAPSIGKKPDRSPGSKVQQGGKNIKPHQKEPETDEEDEGGLSAYLQPGEQVLVGSLNISVKKFFFHAYLTDKRVFLIDTQEKKLKVTAKDILLDTIVGSIVEFSESSDPVLVLSIRSPDDEIKTMKLVFVQNGIDRSDEIDEWIALLNEQTHPKKSSERYVEEPEPEIEYVPPEKPVVRQELYPAKKPAKDHEKQPPVKKLLSLYKATEDNEADKEPVERPRSAQIRQVQEPVKRQVTAREFDREIPPSGKADVQQARKPEVQSAMKVGIKSAMQPLKQPFAQPVRRTEAEPERRKVVRPETDEAPVPPRRAVVRTDYEQPVQEEVSDQPQFCHNCGKKLPHSANFCPGCGTKLGQSRTAPHSSVPAHSHERKAAHSEAPSHERKAASFEEMDEEGSEIETPVPTKPPVNKAPKGSEMTILHKFLRR
jgi:hypothetical protein